MIFWYRAHSKRIDPAAEHQLALHSAMRKLQRHEVGELESAFCELSLELPNERSKSGFANQQPKLPRQSNDEKSPSHHFDFHF
jgi:hypothetical protein